MDEIASTYHWDQWQLSAIRAAASGAAVLVVGAPGSGKTSCLVEAVAACSPTGNLAGTAVLAANRAASQELRGRLVRRVGHSQVGVRVTTVHGLARSIVASADPSLRILTGPEQDHHIRDLLVGGDVDKWPRELHQALSTPQFQREVRSVLARARQLGLDPQDLATGVDVAELARWQALGEFAEQYLTVSDAMGVVDYAELIHRARLALLDDDIAQLWTAQLERVVVDDFQELDPAQVSLLVDLRRLGMSVVAWADPLTRISDFRGVDVRSVAEFATRFAVPGVPAQRYELPIIHRCGPGLVAAMSSLGGKLPVDGWAPRHAVTSAEQSRTGEMSAVTFSSLVALHMGVADTLWRWRDDEVAWHDMAVVTRSGGDGVERLARVLRSAGVPVSVEGDQRALADNPAVSTLLKALRAVGQLAARQPVSDTLARELLASPLAGVDAVDLRAISRAVLNGVGAALADPRALRDVAHPAALSAADLADVLCAIAHDVAAGESAEMALWRVWNATPWPEKLRQRALAGGTAAMPANRDLDAVIALFDWAARRPGLVGVDGLQVLVDEVAGQQIAADTARESGAARRSVTVTTAHRTRAREWRRVVVVDLQEGLWPSLRRRGVIFDSDRLSCDGIDTATPSSTLLHQERRLFLLALSRATEQVVACAVDDEANGLEPSRFLEEMRVPVMASTQRTIPAWSPAQLVGELRRCLTSEMSSPALRRHAADELVRLSDVCGAASPSRWWGMTEVSGEVGGVPEGEPVRLSPSQVEQLLSCPRQWFLRHEVGADTTESTQLQVGTIFHDAAERLSIETRRDQPDPAVIERITSEVLAAVADLSFAAPWQRDHEMAQVRAMVEAYSRWDAGRQVDEVIVEAPFVLELDVDGPVLISGRIDRLERIGDKVRVVDLKTGKTAASIVEGKQHVQLALYQLAVRRGAVDAEFSQPVTNVDGADLVFVRDRDARGLPKVRSQGPMRDDSPLIDDESLQARVIRQVGEAAQVKRSGRYPAVASSSACRHCPFLVGCPAHSAREEFE